MISFLPDPNAPAPGDIQAVVAEFYGVPQREMVSARRAFGVAWPRQMAMALAVELTPLSPAAIGRLFGHRDRTTVIHAVKAVAKRSKEQASTRNAFNALKARLDI